MTKQQFDNYNFTSSTWVTIDDYEDDVWYSVDGVDFPEEELLVDGIWVSYRHINDIKEGE